MNVPDYLQYHVQDVQNSIFLKAFFSLKATMEMPFQNDYYTSNGGSYLGFPKFQTQAYNL